MASPTLQDRFSDREYINRVKVDLALNCVARGLTPFCETVIRELHETLKSEHGKTQCSAGCTAKRICKKHGIKHWSISCLDNICNKWLDGIVPELATSQYTWRNSIVHDWPAEPWQLAKVFMGEGQDLSNIDPDQTDALGLLQLMINCKKFHDRLDKGKAIKVKEIRNQLYHSTNFKVTDKELHDKIAVMVTLLEDRAKLFDDSSAQDAVHDLKEIEDADLELIDKSYREKDICMWERVIEERSANKVAILQFIRTDNELLEKFEDKIQQIQAELEDVKADLEDVKAELGEVKADVKTVRADVDEVQEMAQRNENNIICMQEKSNTTTAVQEGLVAQINQLQENMNKITKDHEQNELAREDQSQHAEPSSDQLQGVSLGDMLRKHLDLPMESYDEMFGVGEQVRLESDEKKAIELQEEHGGWNQKMRKYLGKVGTIKGQLQNLIEVQFSDGVSWHYNKELLQPCEDETGQGEDEDLPFKRYDIVSIETDKDKVMAQQEGHGGWTHKMTSILGANGIVNKVDGDGDVFVEFCNGTTFCVNPNLLKPVGISYKTIEEGDFVLVINSYKKVKALQDTDHGEWTEKMRKNLGSTGIVVRVLPNDCARVLISGHQWMYNVKALRVISKSGPTSNTVSTDDTSSSDSDDEFRLGGLLKGMWKDTSTKSSEEKFGVGEKVLVDSDERKVIQQQEDHGGWNSKMKKYLGKIGTIKGQVRKDIFRVQFSDGQVLAYNQALLQLCDEETEQRQDEESSQPFKRYDIVSVNKNKDTVMKLQDGHGGWAENMTSVIGMRGIINKVDDDGDVFVEFENNTMFWFNPKLLEFIDTSKETTEAGDFVLVVDSYKKVKALQDEDHGGWTKKMQKMLGSGGIIVKVLPNDCARVLISGHQWIYNVKALRVISRAGQSPTLNTASSCDSRINDAEDFFKDLLSGLQHASPTKSSDEKFGIGDRVRVDSDKMKTIRLQKGHGEWIAEMKKHLGKVGIVKHNLPNNTTHVLFADGHTLAYNQALLQLCDDGTEEDKESSLPFNRYDIVCIEEDKDKVMKLQEGLSDWKPSMTSVIGLRGIVNKVNDDEEVFVEFENDIKCWFNPKLLKVVDTSSETIQVGDFVLVMDSYKKVKGLQDELNIGWKDAMRKTLGSAGTVVGVLSNGRARVHISGCELTYNVKALRIISRPGHNPASNRVSSDDSASSESQEELFFKRLLGGFLHETREGKFGIGERVRVESDESKSVKLQEGHGEWVTNMKKYLGKTGIIKLTFPNQIVKVQFSDGQVFSYNQELLQPCDKETEQDKESSQPFKRYDIVLIENDKDKMIKLQKGHGGWKSSMTSVLGLKGIVGKVDDDGDVLVECINHKKWVFNPKLLTVIDTSSETIQVGDFVLVIDSYKKVKAWQDADHGGWNDEMRQNLGSAGIVVGLLSNGRARVHVSHRQWIYNVKALRLIAKSDEISHALSD